MALPADGSGEAKPWRDSLHARRRRAGVVAGRARASRRSSPIRRSPIPRSSRSSPACTRRRSRSWTCTSCSADGSSKNLTGAFDDQVSDPVWSPDGAALFFRAVNNTTYDETVYRYSVAEQKLEPVVRGQESYGRFVAVPRRHRRRRSRTRRTRPISGCFGASGQRTRITDLNPQLARFTFSKPELFYFHNADGERLGALLYKPAGLGPNDKVPVITWVYEKMTPAHPPLRRARSDVHQPRLRDADAEREGEGRADRRLVREVRRAGGERRAGDGIHQRQVRRSGATASAPTRRRI